MPQYIVLLLVSVVFGVPLEPSGAFRALFEYIKDIRVSLFEIFFYKPGLVLSKHKLNIVIKYENKEVQYQALKPFQFILYNYARRVV